MRVLLLFGGQSSEHLVSCRSARAIAQALLDAGQEVAMVGIDLQGRWWPYRAAIASIEAEQWRPAAEKALLEAGCTPEDLACESYEAANSSAKEKRLEVAKGNSLRAWLYGLADGPVDLVYLALHGTNGEDGTVQGLLDLANMPYIGSGTLASASAMDKARTYDLAQLLGIPFPETRVIRRQQFASSKKQELAQELIQDLGLPIFVKPCCGGSSVGASRAHNEAELLAAITEASRLDQSILVQTCIEAREIELAVLGNDPYQVAGPGEIVMAESCDFYDYQTKYFAGSQQSHVALPADVPPEIAKKARVWAQQLASKLGVEGLARVDFFYEEASKRLLLNEVNNLPGFTSISLYPAAFAQEGLPTPALVKQLCQYALEAWEQKQRAFE